MKNGLVDQSQKFKKRIASLDTSRYKVITKGQLVVGFPIDEGVLSFQWIYDAAIVSPAYSVWDMICPTAVDRRYLERYLRSPRALDFYLRKLRATTARRRSIPNDIFLSLPVPLPPIDEQRRIAAILDQADDLRRNCDLSLELLDSLSRSLFDNTRHNALATHSPVMALEDFCTTGSGTTPPRAKASLFYGGQIPWVKSGELRERDITTTNETVTEQALQATSLRVVPINTILLAMYGATIGRVGLLKIPATTNQAVCHIIPDSSVADTTYVYYAVQDLARTFIARGAGGAQPNINQQIVRKSTICLPDLKAQRRFAQQIAHIDALRTHLLSRVSHLNQMSASLKDRVFSGQLLPSDYAASFSA